MAVILAQVMVPDCSTVFVMLKSNIFVSEQSGMSKTFIDVSRVPTAVAFDFPMFKIRSVRLFIASYGL